MANCFLKVLHFEISLLGKFSLCKERANLHFEELNSETGWELLIFIEIIVKKIQRQFIKFIVKCVKVNYETMKR